MSTTEQPTCALIHAGESFAGKQGFSYFEGVSRQSAGSQAICMHLLTIPPGGRARAHLHETHESTIYVINGEAEMWYGDGLSAYMQCNPGDFIYIPAGVPHLPGNRSRTEPCTAVVARTDPNEQESVVLLPELDDVPDR